jgi:hypothetical protein
MKSCEGCRWLFAGKFGDKPMNYCRAIPPVMRIEKVGDDQFSVESLYPLAPSVRCGLFKRRWFGETPKL